jgi:hypothetical protein
LIVLHEGGYISDSRATLELAEAVATVQTDIAHHALAFSSRFYCCANWESITPNKWPSSLLKLLELQALSLERS